MCANIHPGLADPWEGGTLQSDSCKSETPESVWGGIHEEGEVAFSNCMEKNYFQYSSSNINIPGTEAVPMHMDG